MPSRGYFGSTTPGVRLDVLTDDQVLVLGWLLMEETGASEKAKNYGVREWTAPCRRNTRELR